MLLNILVFVFVVHVTVCHVTTSDAKSKYTCGRDDDGAEHCHAKTGSEDEDEDEDDEPVFLEHEEDSLYKWDPVEVGYERTVELTRGEKVKMVTMAKDPSIFRIENFLTDEESAHIIEQAKKAGLDDSGLYIDKAIGDNRRFNYAASTKAMKYFRSYDTNGDDKVTVEELKDVAVKRYRLYMEDAEIDTMVQALGMSEMSDGVITRDEFETTTNTSAIDEYMMNMRENNPKHRDRFSKQVWLRQSDPTDRILSNLRDKVEKLTKLPARIVKGGELLQVLHYNESGHYHAHFDSQDGNVKEAECCHLDAAAFPECRLCRYITIVYYLNKVEEGGETAFPVADQVDFNHAEFELRKKGDLYNLNEFCYNASVVVPPIRNSAVMWYNHGTSEDGWLGDMNYRSLHGGCAIRKGEKWLANNWLVAPPSGNQHRESIFTHY